MIVPFLTSLELCRSSKILQRLIITVEMHGQKKECIIARLKILEWLSNFIPVMRNIAKDMRL